MTEPTTVALTIHITAPGPDAANHAQTIADLVTAEFGDSMRLRIAITSPDYDAITGYRTWQEVQGHQFTGLFETPGPIAATTDQPPYWP